MVGTGRRGQPDTGEPLGTGFRIRVIEYADLDVDPALAQRRGVLKGLGQETHGHPGRGAATVSPPSCVIPI